MEFIMALIEHGFTLESLVFVLAGAGGMTGHYYKKFHKKQTNVKFIDYFGKNNPLSSAATMGTFLATMAGIIGGYDLSTMSTTMQIILGVTCGWTINSGINTVQEKIDDIVKK